MEPNGYTRIGAALRHSGALLNKRQTKNKWIVLISDGKPNDFDKYEGKYGINDVKQALRELNEKQINSYALAIEAKAKYYLPQMFGQNHYQILTTPSELLRSLVKLYEKIKHQSWWCFNLWNYKKTHNFWKVSIIEIFIVIIGLLVFK